MVPAAECDSHQLLHHELWEQTSSLAGGEVENDPPLQTSSDLATTSSHGLDSRLLRTYPFPEKGNALPFDGKTLGLSAHCDHNPSPHINLHG